jgi:outer membrane biosynthesis protein TonB
MDVNHQHTTAMKTRILRTTLLLASVITLGYSRAAGPIMPSAPAKDRSSLDRALNKHLSYPLLEQADMTGEVMVSFVIDKEGKLEVLQCSSRNERLKDYVLRKLARIDIGDNPEGIWRTSHIKFTFRPE